MAKISELLAQREELDKKIIAASAEELEEMKVRLEAISKATGQSISQLLGLQTEKAPTTPKANNSNADDKKYRDWLKANPGHVMKLKNGDRVVEEGTRLTQGVKDYIDNLTA